MTNGAGNGKGQSSRPGALSTFVIPINNNYWAENAKSTIERETPQLARLGGSELAQCPAVPGSRPSRNLSEMPQFCTAGFVPRKICNCTSCKA